MFSKSHRKRYREIISILTKYGLDEFFSLPKIQRIPFIDVVWPKTKGVLKLSRPVRLRLSLEEIGGAYVKLGQLLSNRPDIMPDEYLEELSKLQDKVPPFSSEHAVEIVEKELNQPLSESFLMFDETPLASASIAQVHRAVLFDGTPVVIKIRRPGLKEKFQIDMDVVTYLSHHLSRVSTFKTQFKKKNPIKDLRVELEKELDFSNELTNIEIFTKNFQEDERVVVPRVYPDHSSSKVLTMEFVEGVKVNDIKKLREKSIDTESAANNLLDLGLTQMFTHRFFHGDAHPGNILILDDERICFLDFGLMGRITAGQFDTIIDLIIAFSRKDAKKMSRVAYKAIPKDTVADYDRLESDITELIDRYYDRSLEEINVPQALHSVLTILNSYSIVLPSNIYLLIKSLVSYEGIGRKLYPKFQFSEHAQTFSEEIIQQRLSPANVVKDLYLTTSEAITLIKDLPGELSNLIYLLQAGKLRANISVVELEKTVDYAFERIDKVVNRLVFAIILASMILGSSLILRSAEPDNVPLFSTIGFSSSIIFGVLLLYSMVRNKGL